MLLIHGVYRLLPRKVAYRNDYCRTCRAGHLAERFRTFDVAHLFWVPLLPLGVYRRWRCTRCGQDPRSRTQTGRGMKVLAMVLIAVVALATFLVPCDPKDRAPVWVMRVLLPGLFVALWVSLRRHRPEGNVEALRQAVKPLEGDTCLYCGGKMFREPDWHCRRCEVWRYLTFLVILHNFPINGGRNAGVVFHRALRGG